MCRVLYENNPINAPQHMQSRVCFGWCTDWQHMLEVGLGAGPIGQSTAMPVQCNSVCKGVGDAATPPQRQRTRAVALSGLTGRNVAEFTGWDGRGMGQVSWSVVSESFGSRLVAPPDLAGDGVSLLGEEAGTSTGLGATCLAGEATGFGEGIAGAGLVGGLIMVCPNPAHVNTDYVGCVLIAAIQHAVQCHKVSIQQKTRTGCDK